MNARWLAPRATVELSRPLLPGPLPPKCGKWGLTARRRSVHDHPVCAGQCRAEFGGRLAVDFATPAVDHAALANTEMRAVAICGESRSRGVPPRIADQVSPRSVARASANEGVRLVVYQGRSGQLGSSAWTTRYQCQTAE
jgi:hypothetical protein